MISIDGSLLEGGGQLIRSAISLSAILGKHIKISHIREKRSVPGLANQHLAGVRLIESISHGSLVGDKIKSTEVEFIPGSGEQDLSCNYFSDSGTAGAISLLVQISLPCLLHRKELCSPQISPLKSVSVEYKGGTNVNFSPPIDHTKHVLLPLLSLMTHKCTATEITIIRRGYYPRGGGVVTCTTGDVSSSEVTFEEKEQTGEEKRNDDQLLCPLELMIRGRITALKGVVFGNTSNEVKIKLREFLIQAIDEGFLPLIQPVTELQPNYDMNTSVCDSGSFRCENEPKSNSGVGSSSSDSATSGDDSNELPISILLDDDEAEDDNDENKKRKQDDVDFFNNNKKGNHSSNNDRNKSRGNKRHEVLTVGVLLWFTTTTGCILSSNILFQYKNDNTKSTNDLFMSEVDSPAISSSSTRSCPNPGSSTSEMPSLNFLSYLKESANKVVDEISFLYQSNACVDEHTCDQLLLYMALASGRSRILCAPVCDKSSLHIETVIKIATDLSGVLFNIEEVEQNLNDPNLPSYKCRLITCEGI